MPKGIYKKSGYNGTSEERFFRHVVKTDTCWLWVGAKIGNGYGSFRGTCKHTLAHRFSYELSNGSIPDGMHILHSCDNPSCVNPSHLSIGTHTENMRDMWVKGRKSHIGEKNSMAKLTLEIAEKIRGMYKSGKYSQKEISKLFGVGTSAISDVITNKRWT